jgi:hypothetical protein
VEVNTGATAYDIIGDATGNASPTIRAVIIFLRHFLGEVTSLNSPINVWESLTLRRDICSAFTEFGITYREFC